MRIRRWALLTVVLYALALAALTFPVCFTAFAFGDRGWLLRASDLPELYTSWPYWGFIGALSLVEAGLLLVPVQVARERPVKRWRWTALGAAAGLMMGLLALGLFCAVGEVVTHEPFDLEGLKGMWALIAGLAAWLFWAVLFWRYARAADPASGLKKIVDRLLAGSTAELLVAVPCHVWARSKDYCCAGFGTFVGLATGLAVMLFAFGPGVFFLFIARVRRLRLAAGPEPGGASAERPGPPAGPGPHTVDAALWTLGALLLLGALPLSALVRGEDPHDPLLYGRLSFAVMGGAACRHALLAWRRREPRRGWVLAGAALMAEAIGLTAVWWLAVE